MSYRVKELIRLRKAEEMCRGRAAAAEDGFAALSYAQLADEISVQIVEREAALAGERAWLASHATARLHRNVLLGGNAP
jgi:hypothetical protein